MNIGLAQINSVIGDFPGIGNASKQARIW